ncbi:molybdenum ABC transporter ATP-binding protein [Roseomonas sp. KE2513]|uniref:molybdenum ABC transporter ATP-binding protein n=1 Tax=Roseomonas sp. KE2513 TaxID=2479202 RepID=UPI0018DFCCFA|nr:molybdenum ABC transporter ATP-binding protein [Roseomonas sp. KE2513]MBI0537596.1 molybdenum ABC transporter ATP-binding protein [Roseomonas sp. KE2513]
MLEVSLSHRFGGRDGFLIEAEFATPTPGVTALFGPSGCGKSTLLSAVAGLLRPDRGRIALDGTVLADTIADIALPPERRRCGVVFQDARLFPHLSVRTNLRYGERRAPREATGPGFEEVVELLGIRPLLGRRPGALSGGERQRVALGRALLSRPRLLLMDEPLAALDAPRRAEVLPFLARVRHRFRVPILYVTHALDEVDRLADHLVLMEAGRVLATGTVEDLSARTDLPLLAGRRDAGVALACRVTAHDPAGGLTRLDFAGGELRVPLRAEPAGEALRLRVRARDVSVALTEPKGLSVQNILPAVIESVEGAGAHEAILRLRLGEAALLSRVTAEAASRLALRPGLTVWALVKSAAFGPEDGWE